MKLGKIINALPTLQKLAGKELTIKTLYKVNKLMHRLDEEIKFFNTERNKIIEELCEQSEENMFRIPEENREILNNRIQELSDLDADQDIEPIKISIDEKICLSYNDLQLLEGIIELSDPDE